MQKKKIKLSIASFMVFAVCVTAHAGQIILEAELSDVQVANMQARFVTPYETTCQGKEFYQVDKPLESSLCAIGEKCPELHTLSTMKWTTHLAHNIDPDLADKMVDAYVASAKNLGMTHIIVDQPMGTKISYLSREAAAGENNEKCHMTLDVGTCSHMLSQWNESMIEQMGLPSQDFFGKMNIFGEISFAETMGYTYGREDNIWQNRFNLTAYMVRKLQNNLDDQTELAFSKLTLKYVYGAEEGLGADEEIFSTSFDLSHNQSKPTTA